MFKKILLFIIILNAFFGVAYSQTSIGIKPLRNNIVLNPGQTEDIFLTVINKENTDQIIEPSYQTYVSHDKTGYPVATEISEDDPRNISSWITFESETIEISANSEKKVKATIKAPKNASPGGRYGALIFGPTSSENTGVNFKVRVASLLLVHIVGDEVYDGRVNEFSIDNQKIYADKGIDFLVSFENEGNIHINPRGIISIKNIENKKLLNIFSILDNEGEELILNDIPVNPYLSFVLPELERNFKATWSKNIQEGEFFADLNFSFKKGENEILEEKKLEFFVKSEVVVENFELRNKEGKYYFYIKLKNNGNVHEKPKGTIDILNNFDFKVAEVVFPEEEYLEPNSSKEYEIYFTDKNFPDGDYKFVSNLKYSFEYKKNIDLIKKIKIGFDKNILYISLIILLIFTVLFISQKRKKSKK